MSEAEGVRISMEWNDSPENIVKTAGINDDFMLFAHSELKRFMDPYLPFLTGMLANGRVEIRRDCIHFTVPYAAGFYSGKRTPKTFYHPKATSQWDRKVIKNDGNRYFASLQSYIRGAK